MTWDDSKRKNSLFDNIVIFGKRLPEILRDSGVPDPIIEEFRRDFNKQGDDERDNGYPPITDEGVKWKISRDANWEFDAPLEVEEVKETMQIGYVPPEERNYDYKD